MPQRQTTTRRMQVIGNTPEHVEKLIAQSVKFVSGDNLGAQAPAGGVTNADASYICTQCD